MSDRDGLAALIYQHFGTPDGDIDALNAADAILTRWRLVPVEAPKHWPSTDLANGDREVVCDLCGQSWPCLTYLIEHHPDCLY